MEIRNQEIIFIIKKAINYFADRLHSILSDRDKYVICVHPTHKKGIVFTGMRTIAKCLCKRSSQRIDGKDVLLRAFEIPKKSIGGGGERDLQKEIISLTVRNENIIRGQQVLLMDDITTTGTSLKAGKIVLKRAGAKIVALLALGKTQDSDHKYCIHKKFKIKEYDEEKGLLIHCPLYGITIREGAGLCKQCKYHSRTRV